jgi:hypothetical protein
VTVFRTSRAGSLSRPTAAPQALQNRDCSWFSAPHRGQVITA